MEAQRMRNISFALTTAQIRNRTKTVTRRLGWKGLKPGTLLQPVEKAQGLKKGEHVTKLGPPIRVVAVDRVVLADIAPQDVHREGFPALTVSEFIKFFKRTHGCRRTSTVTRIQFEYLS
jgi:hypothetical protein